jgi:hypothetical protein
MMYVTCSLCGLVVSMPNVDTGALPTCKCKITFITSDSTTIASARDWNESLQAMRDWKVTLHGQIDGTRTLIPTPFQEAFKDGELEV